MNVILSEGWSLQAPAEVEGSAVKIAPAARPKLVILTLSGAKQKDLPLKLPRRLPKVVILTLNAEKGKDPLSPFHVFG